MVDHSKNKEESEKNNQIKQKSQKPTYWERVIKGKGTVAEPWPTAEELWNNVKEEAKEVQTILNQTEKQD